MNRYWRGVTKDNKFVTEAQGAIWGEEVENLKSLELALDDKDMVIKLPDDMKYVQAKTCGADLSSGECQIESRYVGFLKDNCKIIVRVNEKSGRINIETIHHSIQ